jgi:hypothetical protein
MFDLEGLCVPTFFIIGACKAGTTSIYHYLNQHPEINMAKHKEPGYFQDDKLYDNGLRWYLKTFYSEACNASERGEATASYLYRENVRSRIASDLPEQSYNFVVIVRDPVDRAYSQYWHEVRRGGESGSFYQAIRRDWSCLTRSPDRLWHDRSKYIGRGMYSLHLNRWRRRFGYRNIKVLQFEELASSPLSIVKEVCEFLEVESEVLSDLDTSKVYNAGGQPRSLMLSRLLRTGNILRAAVAVVIPDEFRSEVRRWIERCNRSKEKYPDLDEGAREFLEDVYSGEADRIGDWLEGPVKWHWAKEKDGG